MSLERLSDEWITRMFEGIRKEVVADIGSNRHPLMGEATKQRAEQLADELTRRGIQFVAIDWPTDMQAPAAGKADATALEIVAPDCWWRVVANLAGTRVGWSPASALTGLVRKRTEPLLR